MSRTPTPIDPFDSNDSLDEMERYGLYKSSEKVSYWERLHSPLHCLSPPPFSEVDEKSNDNEKIPRVLFGEKFVISEEIEKVTLRLYDAITLRQKYDHEFRYPWDKTKNILDEVKKVKEYDGSMNIPGQVNTGDIHELKMVEGTFQVKQKNDNGELTFQPKVNFDSFFSDYAIIWGYVRNAPAKSFCFERMKFLVMKFDLYKELYKGEEMMDMKETPFRDFYNVRKIDNHIHLAACMNQKSLLNFMRDKMKNHGKDEVSIDEKTGNPKTLSNVCKDLSISYERISVDSLSVRANKDTFHRFDRFDDIFNPFGLSELRKIFLKVDNHMKGKYFGEIARTVFDQYDKYTLAEPRVSMYGISVNELSSIAHWVEDNQLFSKNVRWVIQVPRLFDLNKKRGKNETFQDFLYNIFQPFFHATIFPEEDRVVSNFLQNYLVAFDSVDDESKMELHLHSSCPKPHLWGIPSTIPKDGNSHSYHNYNPPYAYYNYYFWANINTLNQLRRSKGMSTFSYRPHSGEAGDIRHLASSFLLADSINHGIQLKESPVLAYLFYLTRIGMSVSPLSNNYLFLEFNENPFPKFFKAGMNITLSTDDPLMFHNTKEPLMEEYSISQQIMKLSTADICEIARNSVLQSGWPRECKQKWISRYFDEHGIHSNNIEKTNVPQVRIQFRFESFLEEHLFLQHAVIKANESIRRKKRMKARRSLSPREDEFIMEIMRKNVPKLSKKKLIKKILSLQKKRIQLFAHDKQFDLKYWRENLKEEKKKRKKKRVEEIVYDENTDFFENLSSETSKYFSQEEEEESEGEGESESEVDLEMKNDEKKIEELKSEILVIKTEMKRLEGLKKKKKGLKKKTEILEKKFRKKYFVKKKRKKKKKQGKSTRN